MQVMLQGQSAQQMKALVEAQQGKITHYLPIIHAVGAELSRSQLDAILASGLVQRHIDDLAVEDQPPPESAPETPACYVSGAVVIHRQRRGFSWDIHNRHNRPALLKRVTLAWPQSLGRLQQLSLNGRDIPLTNPGQAGTADIEIGEPAHYPLAAIASLQVRFAQPLGKPPPAQNQFQVSLAFVGGCEEELIPGYRDNATRYYYSEVTGADELHRQGIRGGGVTVAVLDSGLWDHPSLVHDTSGRERIPTRYDAIADKLVAELHDETGHGTHLVSIIAHSAASLADGKATGGYQGIAPDATIIPVKAFNVEGQGSMLDIVRGIQWVVDNRERYGIRILNLSFAARPRWPYYLDPVNQAVMQAWAKGIAVIAAAGNEGPELMSVGSPGNNPYIITVGAVTDSWTPADRSDDYIPDFSSRGPTPEAHIKPDLVAPGGHMTGVIRPGSSLTREYPEYALNGDTFVLTGSSQAAAVVSGLAALLLQLEPDLSPDDLKCKLLTGADPAINSDGLLAYSPFAQGYGYVNLARAILLGERGCGNRELDIGHDLSMQEHFEGPAIVDQAGRITLPGLEHMLSPELPAKGASQTRAWGVKSHIERLPPDYAPSPDSPFDWAAAYQREKQLVEALSAGH